MDHEADQTLWSTDMENVWKMFGIQPAPVGKCPLKLRAAHLKKQWMVKDSAEVPYSRLSS